MDSTFIQTVEGDLITVGSSALSWLATQIVPEVLSDLQALITLAITDAEAGDSVDTIVTAVLNLAESQGKTAVLQVETSIIAALSALSKLAP